MASSSYVHSEAVALNREFSETRPAGIAVVDGRRAGVLTRERREPALANLFNDSAVTDVTLVAAARSSEPGAFSALFLRYQPRAHALAFALLKDEADSEEVVQEAFLRVHRNLANFQGSSSFFTWLYRIVTNLSIDLMRKPRRRVLEALVPELLENMEDVPGLAKLESDPFDIVRRKQLAARLSSSVQALPSAQLGVIVMRELEGLSYEEMARRASVSKGTIMSRLFHARQKLQRSLRGALQ